MPSYHYIIAGAGAAGLSLAVHMIHSGQFRDKRILIIDKEDKKKNDRTWCFWEKTPGLFDTVVYKKWSSAWFYGNDFSRLLELTPFEYKLIRGIDFYEYALGLIRKQSNFEIRMGTIVETGTGEGKAWVTMDDEKIEAEYLFNSILFEKPILKKRDSYLLQHFKGWVIETAVPAFNPSQAILMDFRVKQENGTTFVYVMPFSERKALVEYTLFSEKLLGSSGYEEGLKTYLREQLEIETYKVVEEEFGVIPMTNYRFPEKKGNIIYIGTAGGQTKASSGYTFRFIQKHSAAIVDALLTTGKPFTVTPGGTKRFRFYDSVLLHILQHNKLPGQRIFTRLFKKNKPAQVLKFLDNETTLKEELKIISSLPTWPFLISAIKSR